MEEIFPENLGYYERTKKKKNKSKKKKKPKNKGKFTLSPRQVTLSLFLYGFRTSQSDEYPRVW